MSVKNPRSRKPATSRSVDYEALVIQSMQKQWWAPVWKGLVMDTEAKHIRTMSSAVWLYLYLVLNANRETGMLVRKIETVSNDMGLSRDTTLRWFKVLRNGGYIETTNTGRSLIIKVMRWKMLNYDEIDNMAGSVTAPLQQFAKKENLFSV